MKHIAPDRYCAEPAALRTLHLDGLGWGHDLDCGCFHADATPRHTKPKRHLIARFLKGQN